MTDSLEFYIIEAQKARNLGCEEKNKKLNAWLQFINNPEVKLKMENKEIKKAREVLEKISKDEKERYLAELRQKYIMDQKAVEEAGYDKGLAAGIQQGIERGIKQNQIEIAKKLLKKGTKLEEIIELTDLTKEEIYSIKDK